MCKHDHPKLIRETVSPHLSSYYNKLMSSCLICVKISAGQVEGKLLCKSAYDIHLVEDETTNECYITYMIKTDGADGFTMKLKEPLGITSSVAIVLDVPQFRFYVTGDLAFYADMLGMHKTNHWWCSWSLLTHPDWQVKTMDSPGEEHTLEVMNDIMVQLHENPELAVNECKGVSTEMHYPGICPQQYVPPPLHIEIGLVNDVWNNLCEWIDKYAEHIPENDRKL